MNKSILIIIGIVAYVVFFCLDFLRGEGKGDVGESALNAFVPMFAIILAIELMLSLL